MVTYTKIHPAQIRNTGIERSITLVSFYDTSLIDFNQKKKRKVYKEAYIEFVESLEQAINSSNNYTLKVSKQIFYKNNDSTNYNAPISEIYNTLNPELLMVVVNFDLDRPYSTEKIEDEQGNKTKIATYWLKSEAKVELYNSKEERISSQRLKREEVIDEREVLSGLLALGPSVGNYGKVANRLANRMADDYVSLFYPTEEAKMETYYCDKELEKVKVFMTSQRWIDAENLLLELSEKTKDEKRLRQVAHNLSVVYDIIGDKEKRDYWRKKS